MDLTSIQDLLSSGGNHRRGMKILVFGPTGSGKSPFLAAFPRPLIAVDCGEGGIQAYLKPPVDNKPDMERILAGEEDLCVTVSGPEQLDRVVQFAIQNQGKFASFVVDGYNLAWEDHREMYEERFGGEIKSNHWRIVKGPWKSRQFKLMRSTLNVGFSCWMRDILYERAQARPGAEVSLNIRQQEVAAIEKSVPYTVDIIYQMRVNVDQMNRPTPKHEIVVVKARRPKSMDPKLLYVGKTTQWRSDKEEDLWSLAVAPYLDSWKSTEILDDQVEILGSDAEEEVNEQREVNEAFYDGEAGRLIREMRSAVKSGQFKTVKDFGTWWNQSVGPIINLLPEQAREVVKEETNRLKAEVKGDK